MGKIKSVFDDYKTIELILDNGEDNSLAVEEGYKGVSYVLSGKYIQASIDKINEECRIFRKEYALKNFKSLQELKDIVLNA